MREHILPLSIFQFRHKELLKQLPKGAALLLPAAEEKLRNQDVHYPYRQDTDFFYTTGFDEPESVFLLINNGGEGQRILFVRKKDPLRETWDGFRYGVEGAKEHFSMNETYPSNSFFEEAKNLLKDVETIYYKNTANEKFHFQFQSFLKTLENKKVLPAEDILKPLRMYKTSEEIELLKKACEISAQAHVAVMKATKVGVSERALHGVFIQEIMKGGCAREGYPAIVASGSNATTLHYVFNENICKEGEVLLIDAGGEYKYYTGDITRTFPVNGKFTETQKRVYQKLLDLQKSLISDVRPGVTYQELSNKTVEGVLHICKEEGLLKGETQKLLERKAFQKYLPHSLGHFLGSDVHDLGTSLLREEKTVLEEGMVLTIEPGIYIPQDDDSAPEELRGLGIRIEDDILITKEGNENLSVKAPKEVSEMEAIIGSA